MLTAENLRTELITLWAQPDFPTRCVCIVTHNIEEAVLLADRVMVLGSNPGHLKAEVPIHLPRPRDRRSPTFDTVVDQLYGILTGRDENSATAKAATPGPLTHPLPNASVGGLAGLVEIVYAHNGQTDLPDLADELSFDVDDLLPLVDAATMLRLLEIESAQAFLTDTGRNWYTAAGDLYRPEPLTPPQPHDRSHQLRRCLPRTAMRPRGPVGHAGRALQAIAVGPLGRRPGRDHEHLRRSRIRPTLINNKPGQTQPGAWSQQGISVGHEGLRFVKRFLDSSTSQPEAFTCLNDRPINSTQDNVPGHHS